MQETNCNLFYGRTDAYYPPMKKDITFCMVYYLSEIKPPMCSFPLNLSLPTRIFRQIRISEYPTILELTNILSARDKKIVYQVLSQWETISDSRFSAICQIQNISNSYSYLYYILRLA